jgi:chromate transporter
MSAESLRPKASADTLPKPRPAPRSRADLFVSFTLLALQGFGGVLAVVQRDLVEKKQWLTRDEFIEDWAVAQVLPGPNVVNLALMIGSRHFGLSGGLAALAGVLGAPMLVVLALGALYAGVSSQPEVQGALRGMGAVAAGLIAGTGLKLSASLSRNVMGPLVCWGFAAMTFVAVALLRIPLAGILLSIGIAACAVAYWKLGANAATVDSDT